jgi:hypothetical protein
MNPIQPNSSWFDLDEQIIDQFDLPLEAYERQCAAGKHPDRQPVLDLCGADVRLREFMSAELDYLDRFYARQAEELRYDRNSLEQFSEEVPRQIGDYKVLQVVGRGGFGVVICAEHIETTRRVALKIPHPGWLVMGSFEALVHEAELLKTLEHPNIVRALDAGWMDEYWVLITDWIDGRSLEDLQSSGDIDQDRSIAIVIDLLGAIEYAHQKGVVHRDLKARNVMVDQAGVVKLLDFGMAKVFDQADIGYALEMRGRTDHLPPEASKFDDDDPRSDVFSAGVLLKQLCMIGKRLDAESLLHAICWKATRRQQADRFATATDLREALLDLQAGSPRPDLMQQLTDFQQSDFQPSSADRSQADVAGTDATSTSRIWQRAVLTLVAACLVTLLGIAAYALVMATAPQVAEQGSVVRGAPVRIQIATEPAGATVTWVPFDVQFQPVVSASRVLGESPLEATVDVGNCWLIATLPNGTFAEVQREIPGIRPADSPAVPFAVPLIQIVETDLQGMVEFDQFWIDQKMVTTGQFNEIMTRHGHSDLLRDTQGELDRPVLGILPAEAALYAGYVGKRLPTQDELTQAYQAKRIDVLGYTEFTSTMMEPMQKGVFMMLVCQDWKPAMNSTAIEKGFRCVKAKSPMTAISNR